MEDYLRSIIFVVGLLVGLSILTTGIVAGQASNADVNTSTGVEIDSSLTQDTDEQTVIVRLAERSENTVRTTAQKNQVESMKTHAAETQSPFKRFAVETHMSKLNASSGSQTR